MDMQPETPAADPDQSDGKPESAVKVWTRIDGWTPTDAEQDALDILVEALGCPLMPCDWATSAAEDGTRLLSFHIDLPFWSSEDCIGTLVERSGVWQAGLDADPEAEADTLPALAKKLSALWAGPGRWTLAKKQIAREAAEQAAEEAEQVT